MKKHWIILMLVIATLTLLMSGCASGDTNLEGKYIATFDLNGGTLDYGASSINSKVNYAYEPGSYILDPAQIDGYSMFRNEYEFTGWYTSPDCRPEEKWDFSKPFETESLTLYAGWEKTIKFTYTLCYTDAQGEQVLGTYKVDAGEPFEDWKDFVKNRQNHTAIGFYADAELTQKWDSTLGHPGGETDTDLRVYVKYIEGNWNVVSNFDQLKNAMKNGNVYLMSDIDCGGAVLPTVDFKGIFEGNHYQISNFTVEQKGTARVPTVSIFASLAANSEVRDVTFEQVTYALTNVKEGATPKAATLAIKAEDGVKLQNVTVKGSINTNFTGALDRLTEAFFEAGEVEISEFSADITS